MSQFVVDYTGNLVACGALLFGLANPVTRLGNVGERKGPHLARYHETEHRHLMRDPIHADDQFNFSPAAEMRQPDLGVAF